MKRLQILALLVASLAASLVQAAPVEKCDIITIPKPSSTRDATSQEIEDWKYYSRLCASSYCRAVIPLGTWICAYCSELNDLEIVKTFNTLVYDTNAMVARGDEEKTIFVVFRGSNSYQNFVAVSATSTWRLITRYYCERGVTIVI